MYVCDLTFTFVSCTTGSISCEISITETAEAVANPKEFAIVTFRAVQPSPQSNNIPFSPIPHSMA